MFIYKLIQEIKKHPCLFIEDNPAFRDPFLKREAWNEISRNLLFSVEFLKNEWLELRERYQKLLLARIRNRSRNSGMCPELTKFEKKMKFMEYYLQPKKKSRMKTKPEVATTSADSRAKQWKLVKLEVASTSAYSRAKQWKHVKLELTTSAYSRAEQRKVVEPELIEISSSNTTETTEPEVATTSAPRQSVKIPSEGITTPKTRMKGTDSKKDPLSSGIQPISLGSILSENDGIERMEIAVEEGQAPPPDVIPETSGIEKVPLTETKTDQTEVLIANDGYQQRDSCLSLKNLGLQNETEGVSKMEKSPLPDENTTETNEPEIMIVYEGNRLDNRIPRSENVDYMDGPRLPIALCVTNSFMLKKIEKE